MGGVSVYGIDRALWDHPDLAAEPYTQKQAWAWLIGSAAYQQKRIRTTRGPVTIERGEFVHSVRFLALKWLWEKGKTERFLNMLKKRDMIRGVVRDNVTIYFITNYNKFQIVKAPKRDNNRDDVREASGTTAGQQRDKEKDIEDSKDRKEHPSDVSAEPQEAAAPLIVLPANAGAEVPISKAQADDYAQTYPAVDVPQELAEMRRWLIDNPKKRKTVRGMAKFVNGWLAKEQDRGPKLARASPGFNREPVPILSIIDEPKPQCH